MTKNRILSTLLAVSVAFVLWVYVITVVSPNSEATFYNIPVVVQGEPMLESYGLMNVTENIPTVTLKLSGNRSDLNKVNSSNITLIADLSKVYEAGTANLRYSISYPGDVASNAFEVVVRNDIEKRNLEKYHRRMVDLDAAEVKPKELRPGNCPDPSL